MTATFPGRMAILCLLLSGCAVHTPEVTFTSERTALERQILGSYRVIEEDTWELSSVRAAGHDVRRASENRTEAIEACASRLFNADDLEDFKREEVAGENPNGILVIRPESKLLDDAEFRALVNRIVTEENRDRQIIIGYLIADSRRSGATDSMAVYQTFAQMILEASPAGTWFQKPDSTWSRK